MLTGAATVIWSAAGDCAAAPQASACSSTTADESKLSRVAGAPQYHASLCYRSVQTPTVPKGSACHLSTTCTSPPALQVTADIRSIQSKEFFTYHSLRFPRVVDNGIRWDKGAADIETTEHFNRMLMDMKGTFLGEFVGDLQPFQLNN